jgi:hypothetical protein
MKDHIQVNRLCHCGQKAFNTLQKVSLSHSQSTANKWLMKFVSSNLVTKQVHGTYSKNSP